MKLTRCPVCKSHLSLDQLVQDDAGKELLSIVANINKRTAQALVGYLALFRPAKQDLSATRAVKLAREVLALTENIAALGHAMEQTTNSIMAKRVGQPNIKPLANHNYLKQVLTTSLEQIVQPTAAERSRSMEVKRQGLEMSEQQNHQAYLEQMSRYGAKVNKEDK